jgi:Domain of unknown function (DUF3870)
LSEDQTDTVIVVGHARLPQSLSSSETPIVLAELEVQQGDGQIIELHLGGALPGATRLLRALLIGKNIETDFDAALREFQRSYIGTPQRAIVTALTSAQDSYKRHFRQSSFGPNPFTHRNPPLFR